MPPASPMFLLNIRRSGRSTPCGTPTKPTVEPGRAHANACFIEPSVPDALEDGVGADSVGELLDPLGALLAALGHDVGRPELAGDLLALLVARHRDHPLGPHLGRGQDAAQADRAVTDDHDGVARASRPRRPRSASRSGSTSESVSSEGSRDASGMPSVLTRLPSAWVTLAYSP